MNVSLTPELEQFVTERVRTSMYQTASEVVREGLRLLKERDDELRQLRAAVRAGFEVIERVGFEEFDDATTVKLARDIKTRGRRRLVAEGKKARAR
jgi:antitoxin ParD1/3/4